MLFDLSVGRRLHRPTLLCCECSQAWSRILTCASMRTAQPHIFATFSPIHLNEDLCVWYGRLWSFNAVLQVTWDGGKIRLPFHAYRLLLLSYPVSRFVAGEHFNPDAQALLSSPKVWLEFGRFLVVPATVQGVFLIWASFAQHVAIANRTNLATFRWTSRQLWPSLAHIADCRPEPAEIEI